MQKTKVSHQHLQALARLSVNKDYQALKELLKIFEDNIKVKALALNHTDPVERALEHEHLRGQAFMAKRLVREIDDAAKELAKLEDG